jgi:uncharacterized protein YjbJ (UPF0337 family)
MDWKIATQNWDQEKAKVRARWAALTDEDLKKVGGDRQKLVECLADQTGCSRQDAERQVSEFERESRDSMSKSGQYRGANQDREREPAGSGGGQGHRTA